jgi:dimethylglycine catabolism B
LDLFSPSFLIVYSLSIISVIAIFAAVFVFARRNGVSLSPRRFLALSKDESDRLSTFDPVFLMHLSIAIGVALSIVFVLLDPVWTFPLFSTLRIILLAVSIPLIIGLVTAFAWRVQRYQQSKKVEKDLLHTSQNFSSASSEMQLVLIVAILLTTSELVLSWFQNLAFYDGILNIVRNILVVLFYALPTVNLVQNFDRPLPSMRLPFRLGDVLEGKVDASQIKVGVSQISEFENYERLSYDSCVEIGACESACPATAAGRPLSPRILVRKVAVLEKEKGKDAEPLSVVGEDELWSCTSCGACVHSCPVAVKHLDVIYDLRRNLVTNGKIDKEKSTLLQNLSQNQNPYGLSSGSRADWAREQGIPTLSSNPNAEYLFWVGCVSSFDQRAQNIAKSLSKILAKAGVSFAILGTEEMCNGDPARRLGEEGRYQELAYQNIEKMNSFGVKKVITTCPHCFNAIKNEYPQFGGNYEVIHHTEFISALISLERIRIPKEKIQEISLTLHDACYASRFNNIFEAPRKVLAETGAEMHEMHRNKDKTFCCGAGGSNYWYKVPQQRSISGIRTHEARKTGADVIATECPFCLTMFEDSLRVSEGKPMQVKDIAEIVAEQL